MLIRRATAEWLRMRSALWPDCPFEDQQSKMASDRERDNDVSLKSHLALGYEEAGRLIHFRKSLKA